MADPSSGFCLKTEDQEKTLSFCFVKYRALPVLRITTAHRRAQVDEDKELDTYITIVKIQNRAVRK